MKHQGLINHELNFTQQILNTQTQAHTLSFLLLDLTSKNVNFPGKPPNLMQLLIGQF